VYTEFIFYLKVMEVLKEPIESKHHSPPSMLHFTTTYYAIDRVYHTPPTPMHLLYEHNNFPQTSYRMPTISVWISDYNKIISFYSHYFLYNGFRTSSWNPLNPIFQAVFYTYTYEPTLLSSSACMYTHWAKSTRPR